MLLLFFGSIIIGTLIWLYDCLTSSGNLVPSLHQRMHVVTSDVR